MTAVEWLVNEIQSFGIDTKFINNAIEQAKEMEKQQIIDAFFDGAYDADNISGEQYYNETYGSKGSDATSSQTEISDEEIEKFADEELGTIRTDFDFGVIQGMKWYREQLKQRQ